ncbi:TPA: hypothetical protein ACGZ92_002557 [Elizabethkingia anophelis]
MKKNEQNTQITISQKKEYVPPKLNLVYIEMEQGIAAGSANVQPTDINNQVKEDWDTAQDVNNTIDW